ncbi:MAG TPA: DUF4147 domain-containing protein, partial [Vicinamibacterales bacterium]
MAQAGIRACAADALVSRSLTSVPDLRPPSPSADLRPRARGTEVIVLAAGKAAAGMARGALGVAARGLVVAPTGVDDLPEAYECVVGGHPSPNAGSEEGGRKALALAESLSADDTLLVLLSGGASALMAVPADGIALDEKRTTSDRLMREGADIHALNTVRKHLSQIKGGWLAARTRARTVAL